MRTLLSLCLLSLALCLVPHARADDPVVVPGPLMLVSVMNAEANRLLDRRDAEIAVIDTADDVRERQRLMRKWFAEKLGPMPPPATSSPRITGEIDCDGYRVQKVIYETWPDHPVTAAFYLPDGPGPFPGVLLPCGHSDAAKAAEPYQAASILLARHGFAVLCFDPIGQGERRQFPDRDWGSYPSLPEHMEVTGAALLIGRQAASYFVGDLVRSLDYLASRPEVDASRLGCTGISGGGMQTAYLMALDDRLKAAAPGCFITGFRRQLATRGVEEAEQNIGGQLPIGLDHGDYLLMAGPTPSLVLAATRDFFDITGTRATAAEAKRLFGLLGHAERMEIAERDVEHGFDQPLREAALAWMNRWLKDDPSAPAETPAQLLPRERLQCTPEGNVFRAGLGKTAMDLIADEEAVLAGKRAQLAVGRTPEELAATVRALLKLPAMVPTATVASPPAAHAGTPFQRLVFTTEPGIAVPALLAEPPTDGAVNGSRPLAIILAAGDLAEAARGQAASDALSRGMRVLAISVRGTGDTAPQVKLNQELAPLFGQDWQEALLGVLLDRPLLGQKVHDVLAVIAWARKTHGADVPIHLHGRAATGPVALHGRAATGPVALHAAVLADVERTIKGVTLERSLVSWRSLVQARFHDRELGNIVPGALMHYDLPDLAATLGDRLVYGLSCEQSHGEEKGIDFDSAIGFDDARADGIAAGTMDFVGVAAQEIGHALGFTSIVNDVDSIEHSLVMQRRYLKIVDSNIPMSTGLRNGDGYQTPHFLEGYGLGLMDPAIVSGETLAITANDLLVLDAVGWNIIAVPEPASIAVTRIGSA